MITVTAKLANMRKPQDFVVYPFKIEHNGHLIVQSEKAIDRFDPITGEGVLNCKGSNYKYFMHLDAFFGAQPFTFPREFVEACISAQPVSGDKIGGGVYVG